mmetsp:Transcript_97871/g.282382  ORF Transcript_97871/g.282382 Transcript_97871/m.282382 type:complete len:237 (-) Transcript_97871:229-939(-)
MGSSGCKPCCSSDGKANTIIAETPPENNNDAEAAAVAMAESFEPADPEKQEDEQPTKQEGTGIMAVKIVRAQDMNIGLNLDGLDGETAFVDNIIPGSVEDWNNSHDAKERLRIHDRIVAVNGISGDTDKILAELKSSHAWTLVILRSVEVTVPIDCERFPSLGVDLKYSPNGNTLLIASLGDGPIGEYNSHAPEAMKIKTHDRIVAINGTRGSAKELLKCASNAGYLELTILHYDP